ncbi:galactose-binding domain-like protein [Entophlyctis helioformis]|nr:galactose-binding domain-like protein [Entophlyctis helioformis]
MSCQDESHSHDHSGHSHGHGHGHGHDHDHDHDGPDRGDEFTLYTQVNYDGVRCLNEAADGSARKVFKPWDQRFDTTAFIESDADEQLILFIPFTGLVKLKSIALLGFNDSSTPATMKAFTNREDVDFDTVESTTAQQEWELIESVPSKDSIPEYPTKMARFSNLRNLTLYFPANFGASTTKIRYIGLKGEWTQISKNPVITLYESAPNPNDHKIKGTTTNGSIIQ